MLKASLPLFDILSDLLGLPSDDLYTNAKCVYPGTLEYHFLFPTVYHRADDNCSIAMMSSPDGIHWSAVPGNPIVTGAPETCDHGCLFTSCGLVPLGGDTVGLPYQGSTFPHKYPRWKDRDDGRHSRYAVWERGRLACLEAPGEGCFTTPALRLPGRQLRLDCSTAITGEIRVEAVAITSWEKKRKVTDVIAGHRFEDCAPITGNHRSRAVTWVGQTDLGHARDQPVQFRLKLRAAKLYGFECV